MSSLHPHPHPPLLLLRAVTHPPLPNRLLNHRLLLHLIPIPETTTRQMTLLPRPTRPRPQAQGRPILRVERRPTPHPAGRRLRATRRTLLPQTTTETAACPASRSRSNTRTRLAECTAANAGPIRKGPRAGTSGSRAIRARLSKRSNRWRMLKDDLGCKRSTLLILPSRRILHSRLVPFPSILPFSPKTILPTIISPSSAFNLTAAHSLEDHLRAMPALIRATLCFSLRQGTIPAARWSLTPGGLAGSAMVAKGLEEVHYMAEALLRSGTVR